MAGSLLYFRSTTIDDQHQVIWLHSQRRMVSDHPGEALAYELVDSPVTHQANHCPSGSYCILYAAAVWITQSIISWYYLVLSFHSETGFLQWLLWWCISKLLLMRQSLEKYIYTSASVSASLLMGFVGHSLENNKNYCNSTSLEKLLNTEQTSLPCHLPTQEHSGFSLSGWSLLLCRCVQNWESVYKSTNGMYLSKWVH